MAMSESSSVATAFWPSMRLAAWARRACSWLKFGPLVGRVGQFLATRAVATPASRARAPGLRHSSPQQCGHCARLPLAPPRRDLSASASRRAAMGIEQAALGVANEGGRGGRAGRGYPPASPRGLAHLTERHRGAVQPCTGGRRHPPPRNSTQSSSVEISLAASQSARPPVPGDPIRRRSRRVRGQGEPRQSSPLAPMARPRASRRMDLPAPVSPVSAPKAPPNSVRDGPRSRNHGFEDDAAWLAGAQNGRRRAPVKLSRSMSK